MYKQYEIRRKFWVLAGAELSMFEAHSQTMIGYIKMKAWKLREDVRLYRDKTMQQELMRIHARQIIDIGATYDVFDSATDQTVFSLRRKGLKSIFVRDHWDLLDTNGNVFGEVQETSGGLALVRRWIGIIPYLGAIVELILAFVKQTYELRITASGTPVVAAKIVHEKNPFKVKMSVDATAAPANLDPRVVIAATSMLSIVEAAKQ